MCFLLYNDLIMKKALITVGIIILFLGVFYTYLWFASRIKYHVDYGISFNRQHAQFLGLVWEKAYIDMLDELKPRYIRLSATWNEAESEQGKFKSPEIDWQMAEADKRGIKVALVVGQKAPRWPECHVPGWAESLSAEEYKQELLDYIKTIVERYKNNPALEIWQVENEPFIRFRFGNCERFDESLVKEEINLVKSLDQAHKIMITDSGELSTWRKASRAGDIFGTTLYRVVRTPGGHVWTYDWLPAAFYRLKAKFWSLDIKNVFVSELQAEPWFVDSNPNSASIAEQEETMNPERLQKHFDYVSRIGVTRAYLWGAEWWYWMKEKQGDARYWNFVKEKLLLTK